MRRYLLDTGVVGVYVDRRTPVHARVREMVARGDHVGTCMPVIGELFSGVELSNSREKNRQRLIRAIATVSIWPFDRGAAEEYGRVFARLRRAGRPIQQIDIQIAAIALNLGNCTVVSTDSDFRAIPELRVEDWSVPA